MLRYVALEGSPGVIPEYGAGSAWGPGRVLGLGLHPAMTSTVYLGHSCFMAESLSVTAEDSVSLHIFAEALKRLAGHLTLTSSKVGERGTGKGHHSEQEGRILFPL